MSALQGSGNGRACSPGIILDPRASSLKMQGLSLWEGRLLGQKTIKNEDKAAIGPYRPESNFGTSDTVPIQYF